MAEQRRNDEFQRLGNEVEELRKKNEKLSAENEDLESRIKAKSDFEFYSGIIGTAFPGLASLFNGTPLAQAASFLAGTGEAGEKELPESTAANEDAQGIAALVSEFCAALNTQELAAIHLLFMAFEADRSKIQTALHFVTATSAG